MPPRGDYHHSPQHHRLQYNTNLVSSLSPPQYRNNNNTKRSCQRSVTFAEDTSVRLVPFRESLSAEERSAVWYNSKEYKRFRQDCKVSADAAVAADSPRPSKSSSSSASTSSSSSSSSTASEDQADSSIVCFRGVEKMTPDAALAYREKRERLLHVLLELAQEGEDEKYDANEIAELMIHYTSDSVLEARLMGKADQDFAFRYLKVGRHNLRRRCSVQMYNNNSNNTNFSRLNTSLPNLNTANVLSPLPTRRQSSMDNHDHHHHHPAIRSRRKMRAETGRLFREEYLSSIQF